MKIMQTKQSGITLIELMVALAIGSFLMVGAVQIYSQSRQAFVINESIARVQETAQFAMDTIEADLRMASNWGRNSRGLAIEGRSIIGDVNPNGLAQPAGNCAPDWVMNLALPIDGSNNAYELDCAANGGNQANSDVVTKENNMPLFDRNLIPDFYKSKSLDHLDNPVKHEAIYSIFLRSLIKQYGYNNQELPAYEPNGLQL